MASQEVHNIIGTDDECTNSDATGDSKIGDQENVGLSPVNVDAPLKRHSFFKSGERGIGARIKHRFQFELQKRKTWKE